MSYCKFSDDDWTSDVHVHVEDGRYLTVVAAYRYRFTEPLPDSIPSEESRMVEFVNREIQVQRMVNEDDRVKIELPGAGRTHIDATAQACLTRLQALMSFGFRVPSHALDRLREEIAHETKEEAHA